ncbi:MAG: S8 family serine peptidase [Pseudomonas sp.]
MGLSGKGVDIGVLDSGFMSQHPLLTGSRFHPLSRTLELDGTQRIFDANKITVSTDEDGIQSFGFHGTSTTGIVAANPNAVTGYRGGVAQGGNTYFTPFDPTDTIGTPPPQPDGYDNYSFSAALQPNFASGFQALMQASPQLRIISNSWNDDPIGNTAEDVDRFYQQSMEQAQGMTLLQDTYRQMVARDILLVFAAGNESSEQPGLMATLPRYMPELTDHFLSVVAVDENQTLTDYSNHCGVSKDWCIAAPGGMWAPTAINSPGTPMNYGLNYNSGTSFATPLVSGSAALLAERFPYMNMGQVRDVMLTTATQMGEERVDDTYGWGLLNLSKAINGPEQLLGDQTYTLDANATGWAANDTWSNDIVAGGRLTKAGTGSLTLAGATNNFDGVTVDNGRLVLAAANTFSQTSRVEAGELLVDGSLSGPQLDVQANGSLGGAGSIAAPTLVAGTLAPGHDGGALTFNDSLTLSAQSTTRIEHNGTIVMSGPQANANLNGTLAVTDSDDGIVLATDNGGSYSGGFTGLQQDPELTAQGLRYDLAFGANDIRLGLNSTQLPGQERLQRNALAGAELLNALRDEPSLALRNSGYNRWLTGALASGNLGGLESKIGGQVHADAFAYLAHAPQQLQQSLRLQLAQANTSASAPKLWVNGLDDNLTHEGAHGIEGSKDNTGGLQAGLTQTLNEQLALSGGLSQSKGKVRTSGDRVDIDLTYLSLGTRYGFESLDSGPFLGGQVGVGYLDYSSKRQLGALGTAKGNSNGWMNNAAINGGYRWKFDSWYVEPQAGLQVTRLSLDNIHEKNSEVNLNVKQGSHTYSSALFDVKAGRSVQLNNWVINPSASLGYERALNDGPGTSKATTPLGYSLEQTAAWQGKDLFKAGLNLDATYGDWGIGAGVQGVTGSGASGGGANVQVNYQF